MSHDEASPGGGRADTTRAAQFSYAGAFARNLGWITAAEQERLRCTRVAIAGLGGVGGSHLMTLARLGIGSFAIADLDRFELANFNRQAGASMETLGEPKTVVLERLARSVNPELRIDVFANGVDARNAEAFLAGADVYVDGLDFFAFDARRTVFAACGRLGIPAVTAAPLGMGAAWLNFMPGGMSFEQYFRLEGCDEFEMAIRFAIGLSPALLHRTYLAVPSSIDLAARRGPSTAMACELCAGIAATEVLKIVLRRGEILAAPRGGHFDAFRSRFARTWRPWGNRNPLQRAAIAYAKARLRRALADA